MSAEPSVNFSASHYGKTESSVNKSEPTVKFTPPRSKGGVFGNSSGYAITEASVNK